MYFNKPQSRITLLKILGSGVLGAMLGMLLGRQFDIILNIDGQIVGLVLGSIIGSLVWSRPRVSSLIPAVAAGLGVLVPALAMLVAHRAQPSVVWTPVAVAFFTSGSVGLVIARWKAQW